MFKRKFLFTIVIYLIASNFAASSDKGISAINLKLTQDKFHKYNIKAKKLCEAGQANKALLIYKYCVSKAIAYKHYNLLSYYYNEIGNIEADFGNNTSAFKNYQNSLKYNINNSSGLKAKTYKNIGALYLSWKKLDIALSYYNTAYQLAKKINDIKLIADCLNNMGTVYEQQKRFKKAEYVYKTALLHYKNLNIDYNICITYNNLAILSKVTADFKQAILYYKEAIKYAKKDKNNWIVAAINNNVGNLLCDMGFLKPSKIYLNNALMLAKKINANELIYEALENLSKLTAKEGNFKLAYNYYKQSADAKNTFINTENTKQIFELQTKFDVFNKEKKIIILKKENTIQKLTIAKNNMWLFGGAIFFIFSVAILILYLSRNKIKQQNTLQQTIIKQQDISTKAIIAAEENERSRIAAELHDGVGQLFSTVKMNLSGIEEHLIFKEAYTKASFEKTILLVDESCKEIRSISHQMVPNVLLKMGLVSAIRDFITKVDVRRLKINLDVANLSNRLPANTETVLYRVIQETVNNVIKHAQATVLDIQILRDVDGLSIMIEDNGKGFDITQFKNFEGMGFKNLNTRIKFLNGTFEVDSTLGKGTLISIWVPLQ